MVLHRIPHRLSRLLVLLVLGCWVFLISTGAQGADPVGDAGQSAPPASVLVLHSYGRGNSRTDGLEIGIGKVLSQSGLNVRETLEYLQADRLAKLSQYPRILETKRAALAAQLDAAPPNAVLLSDKQAMDFWVDNFSALAPALPVVFCGVGEALPSKLHALERVTGVVERPGFEDTVKTAITLVPGARKLLVLGFETMNFQAVKDMLVRDLENFTPKLAVEYFPSPVIAAMEGRLRELGPEWLVLVVGRPEENGRLMLSLDGAARICQASPVPVFAVWNSWMGYGPVGGKIIDPVEQGRVAGELVLEILRGRDARDVPALAHNNGTFVFDYNALKRFGLDEALLPQDSVLLNKPVSFYEGHTEMVWTYGVVTALLFVLSGVLGLWVAYRRKVLAQQAGQVSFVHSLMEGMPTPVYYKDVSGVYQGCNQAFEKFFNRSREMVVGRTAHDLTPGDLAVHFEAQDKALIAGGPTQTFEQEMDTPDGRRQVVFNKALFFNADGRAAGLVGVITDITVHRQVERELEGARNYLQGIIDSSPSAIVCVDRSGRITHTNVSAASYCGESKLGCALEEAPRLAKLMDSIIRAIDEDKPLHLPKRAYRENGELRFEDVVIYPLSAIGLSEAVVRVEDATERVRLEEVLVQTEKMMSVGGLAAGMAHEINNPLGGIMQSLQVVLNRLRPELPANLEAAAKSGCDMGSLRAYLERREILSLLSGARTSAQRAAGIVANMLEFSRRSGSAWLQEDVGELVEKAVELCQQDYDLSKRYDFRKITIVKELDPACPAVHCSAQQIQQVILNLIRNAAQALTTSAASEPRITVRAVGKADHVTIEIEDNGPGMDEATRRKVFEPFFTTKSPGQGTGLGLSISYFIITENHGGRISVESEAGRGTRFIIELPLENVRFA